MKSLIYRLTVILIRRRSLAPSNRIKMFFKTFQQFTYYVYYTFSISKRGILLPVLFRYGLLFGNEVTFQLFLKTSTWYTAFLTFLCLLGRLRVMSRVPLAFYAYARQSWQEVAYRLALHLPPTKVVERKCYVFYSAHIGVSTPWQFPVSNLQSLVNKRRGATASEPQKTEHIVDFAFLMPPCRRQVLPPRRNWQYAWWEPSRALLKRGTWYISW